MKVVVIYHGNCADGFGAAWAVRHGLKNRSDLEVEYYPGVYQQNPPDVTGKVVVLVDFSYKRDVILKMAETAKSILILDHHKSAVEDLVHITFPALCLPAWLPDAGNGRVYARFDMEKSGAMLAWEHFNESPAPLLIQHIQDRDLWQFKMEGTREIQAAVFSYPYDFEVWDELMSADVARLWSDGKAIERKHFKDIHEFIGVAKQRMTIAGYNVPVLNLPYFGVSDAAGIMAKGEPFAACYWDTPNGRVFGLRSTPGEGVDVSEIAKQYGGGGHKHSAGFTIQVGRVDAI